MRFVAEHSDRFAVALLLRVLNIAESTYYAWKRQVESGPPETRHSTSPRGAIRSFARMLASIRSRTSTRVVCHSPGGVCSPALEEPRS